MSETVTIGSVRAQPGTVASGFLNVTVRPDGSPLGLPVIIVNGASPGPKLCVNACVHGDEYEGVEAIFRLVKMLDPKKFKGTLIVVPAVNVPAYEAGTRVSMIDHLNMNRVFPGKPEGMITEQIAHIFITQIVSKVKYLVDLHSAGMVQVLLPLAIYEEAPTVGKASFEIARAFGTEFLWKSPGYPNTLGGEATKMSVAGTTIEMAGEGRAREEDVKIALKGILNVLKHLGMIEGRPDVPQKALAFEGAWGYSKHGGFLRPAVKMGEKVVKGQLLGTIVNLLGEEVERDVAPYDGIVAGIRTFPKISPGDWNFFVGKIIGEVA